MKQLYNKFYQAMDIDKMIWDTTELMYVEMPQTYTAYGKVVQKIQLSILRTFEIICGDTI